MRGHLKVDGARVRRRRVTAHLVECPAEIDRHGHAARRGIDTTRDADPDHGHVVDAGAGVHERQLDGGGDRLGGAILVPGGGGPRRATEDGAVGRRDEDRDLGAAEVRSNAHVPRSTASSPVPPLTISVSRASVASVRRCASSRTASNHGSPSTVALPSTTIRRISSAPVRLATAAPSARPAERTTPRAISSPSVAAVAIASMLCGIRVP